MSEDTPYPWPLAGDELFSSDGHWSRRAVLPPFSASWSVYAEGYKRAGDLIASTAETHDLDFVVYPLVFLYRQCVELHLKDLHRAALNTLGQRPSVVEAKAAVSHDLMRLWRQLERRLGQLDPSTTMVTAPQLQTVGAYIVQLDAVDPGSFVFRYPEDTAGASHVWEGIEHLNVQGLMDAMERLTAFFTATGDWIGELWASRD